MKLVKSSIVGISDDVWAEVKEGVGVLYSFEISYILDSNIVNVCIVLMRGMR